MKDGKRTNLRSINLYRPLVMNPRGRLTEIEIGCLESRPEMPAFASEIDQVLEEGASSSCVILAIGQTSFLADTAQSLVTDRGTLRIDETTLATPVAGALAGGEAVTEPSSVIQATATDTRAAVAIDRPQSSSYSCHQGSQGTLLIAAT